MKILEIQLQYTVTKGPAQEQLSVINHLMFAAVAKPNSTALLSHVDLPAALTSLEQNASMSSVKDAVVCPGSLYHIPVKKLPTSVIDSQSLINL